MIHLRGMGVLGCFLALALERRGAEFTWSDSESLVNAWQASTGSVMPSGDESEQQAYQHWLEILGDHSHPIKSLNNTVYEPAKLWFLSKNAPHGSNLKVTLNVPPFSSFDSPSIHVNVQSFVSQVRDRFKEQRLICQPKDVMTVHSRGFNFRVNHYLWGWSARIRIDYDSDYHSGGIRPCFYMRVGRFKMYYLYPRPGTSEYYAGSSMIRQTTPTFLGVEDKFKKFLQHVDEVAGGKIIILDRSLSSSDVVLQRNLPGARLTQGWRPCPLESDGAYFVWSDGQLFLKPLSYGGIRYAPFVTRAVIQELEL